MDQLKGDVAALHRALLGRHELLAQFQQRIDERAPSSHFKRTLNAINGGFRPCEDEPALWETASGSDELRRIVGLWYFDRLRRRVPRLPPTFEDRYHDAHRKFGQLFTPPRHEDSMPLCMIHSRLAWDRYGTISQVRRLILLEIIAEARVSPDLPPAERERQLDTAVCCELEDILQGRCTTPDVVVDVVSGRKIRLG
ncbi:MAG: hypothetical protein AAF368_12190 [Planctomycetota bacterium]